MPDAVASQAHAGGKILSAKDDGVGLITFNQPDKLNAMSASMWDGLTEALNQFANDNGVRVVIISGAGHKAFVSGADLSEFEDARGAENARRAYDQWTQKGRAQLDAFAKPVIARIRGFCLGGGLAIAMQADLRIAAADSVFGIPAARLGIAYVPSAVERLVGLVGPAHARMLLYTGMRIDGAEAERIGLVNRVVPDEELSDRVLEIARMIADNAPLSIAASKLTVAEMTRGAAEPNAAAMQRAIDACWDSADAREGRRAFIEKRPPRFQGT